MTNKLPPLPEPESFARHPCGLCTGFTKEQMLAYAYAAVEAHKSGEAAPAAQPQAAPTDARIREIFLANGFTIKEGQADLKPYVFAAAHALLDEAQGAQAAPSGLSDAQDAKRYRLLRAGFGDMGPEVETHNAFVDGGEKLDAECDRLIAVAQATGQELLPGTFDSAEELIMALRSDRAIFGLNDDQLREILVRAQYLADDWADRQLTTPTVVETGAKCVKEIVRLIYMAKQP